MRATVRNAVVRTRRVLRSGAVRFGGLPHSEGTVDSPPPEVAHDITGLWLRNMRSRASVVDVAGTVDVSMTTHGRRVADVWLAIESIARGTARPRRLILWLDGPQRRLPWRLRRLQRRGLEILRAESGLGVHTKYWPYVTTQPLDVPLVLADDDIVYPPTWLELLHTRDADTGHRYLVAYRAHEIAMISPAAFAPYMQWPPCSSSAPSYRHFPTAVSGLLLPPALLRFVYEAGTAFLSTSPTNDDLWLHACAVRAGIPVVQVTEHQQHWYFIPLSQTQGLNAVNVFGGANDRQMAAAHDELTRGRIWRSIEEAPEEDARS
ncbi:hypothetical protein EV279_2837 [Microbacterium sp. BK668]|nr:hypothetical protein EV279_2837 [Microbacterium sp. BK668]